MRIWRGLFLGLLITTVLACGDSENRAVPGADSQPDFSAASWPIFRGDRGLTGVATGRVPDTVRQLWSYATNGAIIASPVSADKRVFVASEDGGLSALDLHSGEVLWRFEGSDSIEASPMLVENIVVVGTLEGELLAFDARTGEKKWSYATNAKVTGSANWIELPDGNIGIVVGSYDGALHCIDAATGAAIWIFETTNYINSGPAVAEGKVVFGGCDGLLHVLSGADGSELLAVDVGSYAAASPAVYDSVAYLGTFGYEVLAVDLESGVVRWRYESEHDPGPFVSCPAVTNAFVVIGSRDGRVHALNRATGAQVWTFQTDDEVDSSPVIVGQKVVVASVDGRVYALQLADGSLTWSYEIGSPITATPAVIGEVIVIGAEDGRVDVLDREEERF